MKANRPWSAEDTAYILAHCEAVSTTELAVRLGKTRNAVDCWLRRHKVKRLPQYRRWTKAEVWELMRLCERYGLAEIARRLNRNQWSIWSKMRDQGLRVRMAVYSQKSATEATGYAISQLHRARKALGQHWRQEKYNRITRYTILERQLEELTDWLRQEQWAGQTKRAS
jgi:hypothetical protein